jgi:hypothetical protein
MAIINPNIVMQAANIPRVQISRPESMVESLTAIAPGINAMRQLEASRVDLEEKKRQRDALAQMRQQNLDPEGIGRWLMTNGRNAQEIDIGSKIFRAAQEDKMFRQAFPQPQAAGASNALIPAPTAMPAQPAAPQPGGFPMTPEQLGRIAASGERGAKFAATMGQFIPKPQTEPEKLRLMKTLGFPQTKEGYRQFEEFGRAPQDTRTSDIKNYEEALKGGFGGSFYDYQAALKKAGAQSSTIKVDAFVPASEQAQVEYVKEISATRRALANAADTIKNVEAAKALIPTASTFMGTGGEPLLAAASFLNNRLGFSIATRGITDATELRTRLFEGILDNLKKLDSQPSQEQQRVLGEALGNLGTDPSALPRILDRIEETMRDRVGRYNQDVTEAENRGVRFPYKPQIDLPPVKSPSSRTSAGAGQSRGAPPVGTIQDGYRFRGGDPGEPSNWEQL